MSDSELGKERGPEVTGSDTESLGTANVEAAIVGQEPDAMANDGVLQEAVERENVLWLDDQAAAAVELVGSKAANLARLARAGFPVPAGFVIPTTAFEQHVRGLLEVGGCEELRPAIMNSPLPPCLINELTDALVKLGDRPVAVRSSGVAEDLQGASFAGQYDTFLGLTGVAEVGAAVVKCWASAFGERVLWYQGTNQVRTEPMAVLVQSLVEADAAGVAFTANPVTGERDETVVSAVKGLGERLVSGLSSPDEWFVRAGEARAHSTPEGAIDEEQALQVASLAREVEAHFGQPQDIEWAIQGQELYLLQARPITTLAQPDQEAVPMSPLPIEIPQGYWEREESHYPDPISPASRSTFVPAINRAFRLMCAHFSLFIEALEQREIGGWIYQRTVPLGGKDMPTPPAFLVPLLIRLVPQLRNRIRGSVEAVREDRAGRTIGLWESQWKADLVARRDQLGVVELADLSDEELREHLEEVLRFTETALERHMFLNGAIQLILAEYAFACRDLLGWDEAQMMAVFSGLSETSSAPGKSLAQLAAWISEDAQLKGEIVSGVPLARLQESNPGFMERFERHISEFGCRALRHEVSYPTVAESPELLLRLLRDQLQGDYDPVANELDHREHRQAQLAHARRLLDGKTVQQKQRFENALERAQRAYPIREEHGFFDRDAPVALLRYALLEAGSRLADREQLAHSNDVFYLEFDEVLNTIANGSAAITLVERRKAERNWVLANPGPASYGSAPAAPPSMASFPQEARTSAQGVLWTLEQTFAAQRSGQVQHDAANIEGIPASGGQYTGTVRVIMDESQFDRIQPGDVMVCPITSPVWSMLFPSIGALVTDSGGILSHSAIIAREYRIPAVVATGNATELLTDGQLVRVDGGTGEVKAL